MFYSPKKDIQRYVTLKNHQIKTLRQQLQSQKITEQNIEVARKKLQKLKNQYNVLISQNHHELINALRKADDKGKLCQQQICLKQKQLKLKISQKSDVIEMKKQILDKINKAKDKLAQQKNKKAQLTAQRQTLDASVLKYVAQNQKLRLQNEQTQQIVQNAQRQLKQCKSRIIKNQQKKGELQSSMNELGSKIINQKQDLGCMKAQTKIQQLKMENLEMKIQWLLQTKSNLLQQRQQLNSEKLISKQRTQLNKHQSMSGQVLSVLVKISNAMKQSKQVEKQACQRQIKQKLIQLELTECVQNQLREQVSELNQKIASTQQSSSLITRQLKNIPLKDSDLVSMIVTNTKTDNKVLRPINQNKQNIPKVQMNFKQNMWSKLNPLELAKTCEDQSEIQTA